MTWDKWVLLGIGAVVLVLGLVLLITGLIRKKKLITGKILPILVAVIGAVLVIVPLVQANAKAKEVARYNYAACRLLELDDYQKGREAAEAAYSVQENSASAQLIAISLAAQERYALAADTAGQYLGIFGGSDFTKIQDLCTQAEAGASIDAELSLMQTRIKDSLKLSKSDKEKAESIVNVQHSVSIGQWSAEMEENLEALSNSSDSYSLRTAAQLAGQNGDMWQAYELMEKAATQDDTFAAKAALAQMAAAGYSSDDVGRTDSQAEKYQQQISDKYLEMQELQAELSLEESERKIESLNNKIEKLEEEIASLQYELQQLPVKRAILYMQASKPQQRDMSAYRLSMAMLYYRLGDVVTAREYLTEILTNLEEARDGGFLWAEIRHLMQAYEDSLNASFSQDESETASQNRSPDAAAEELIAALTGGLINGNVYPAIPVDNPEAIDQETLSFTQFLLETVAKVRSGLNISGVDASAHPEIAIQFSISEVKEDGSDYEKSDITLYKNGQELKDFTLEKLEETEQSTSICIVFDHSGSMDGSRIEEARSAVSSFVQASAGAQIGLVAFDDSAEILCPVTDSTGQVQKQVDALYADGGTYIGGGLRAGMEALSGHTGQRIIVLLSDGEDGGSPEEMEQIIGELAAQGIAVYAIGIGGADSAYLNNICTKTGGSFLRSEEGSAALSAAYRTIGNFISGGYVIRFTLTDEDDPFKLKVKLVLDNGLYDEQEFDLGVSPEEIAAEEKLPPYWDYYRQRGGSMEGAVTVE